MKKIIHPCDAKQWDGKKYPVFCKIELTDGRLSISGVIGPNKYGNAKGGCGQIEMEFDHLDKTQNDARYEKPIPVSDLRFAKGWGRVNWYRFLDVWNKWHLNDMKSTCEHQEILGWTYDTHKGQKCPDCGYEIGTEWKRREVPRDVIAFLELLPETDITPNWV